MREVHADNVQTGGSQLVDGLDRVRLGADGADDRGSTQVPLGVVFRVEGGQPLKLTTGRHVVEGICSHGSGTVVSWHLEVGSVRFCLKTLCRWFFYFTSADLGSSSEGIKLVLK